jgi:hypothetical protein
MKKTFGLFLCALCTLMLIVSLVVDANADSFTVKALQNSSSGGSGFDTLLDFSLGDMFTVNVNPNDLWNAGALPRWSNANGLIANLYATGSDESGQLAGTLIGTNFGIWTQDGFSAPYGSLVGKIGTTYLLLGTSFSGPAPATGRLILYYWDSYNSDNTNQLDYVNVKINGVPEPGTILLLGFGLVGLAGVRRIFKK